MVDLLDCYLLQQVDKLLVVVEHSTAVGPLVVVEPLVVVLLVVALLVVEPPVVQLVVEQPVVLEVLLQPFVLIALQPVTKGILLEKQLPFSQS